jgi:transcription antitermination protein NusB
MDTQKIGRRSARRRAFQCVFAMHFRKFADRQEVQRAFAELPEEDFDSDAAGENPARTSKKTAEDREFALHLAGGVHLWQEELDGIIRKFSRHWRIERIAKTELSILRLGVYEMLHEPDIPLRVSINEAVELSKEFGDEQSFPFVNGILDAVARAVGHGEFGIHKEF